MIKQPLFSCDLPPQMVQLCELIGWDKVLKLVNTYGGTYIMPTRCARRHDASSSNARLTSLIGGEAYDKLAKEFDGTKVYIPKCDDAMRKIRNMEISKRFLAGEPAAQLALAYRLTERQIWSILKTGETLREEQPDLFG
jgi:hypothetical protein